MPELLDIIEQKDTLIAERDHVMAERDRVIAERNRSNCTVTPPIENDLIAATQLAVRELAVGHESSGASKQNPGERPGFGNR